MSSLMGTTRFGDDCPELFELSLGAEKCAQLEEIRNVSKER